MCLSSRLASFNPRAPSRTRATVMADSRTCDNKFQSSRALADARYTHRTLVSFPAQGFNPRAPSRTRATFRFQGWQYQQNVSILARPRGRALRRQIGQLSARQSFNPRAPSRTRATSLSWPPEKPTTVSILARPRGRALHERVEQMPVTAVFQSSRALADARYSWSGSLPGTATSFNPRAPSRTRATRIFAPGVEINVVSILARPRGRALPGRPCSHVDFFLFQSSRALADARYASRSNPQVTTARFQSSRALADARYPVAPSVFRVARCFNPRAPSRTRATEDQQWQGTAAGCFNPRAPSRTRATWRAACKHQ